MSKSPDPILDGPEDTDGLTDADWAEISRVKKAYTKGGADAFWLAIDMLTEDDVVLSLRVVGAFFPQLVTESRRQDGRDRNDAR